VPPTTLRRSLPAILCAALPASLSAGDGALLEATPFSLPALEMRKISDAVAIRPEHAVVILAVEQAMTIDEEGRLRTRLHYVYRIDQEAAAQYWGSVSASWTAWFEDQPTIRARVITPDGREHALDPSTLAEFRPQQKDPEVFTDRKELKAPLPMVAKGSVVEIEISSREFRPFSRAGVRSSCSFENNFPIERARFTLEAPRSANLKLKCEGFSEKLLQRSSQGGNVLHRVSLSPLLPPKRREPFEAPDQELTAVVKYTTTPSWKSVAREYAAILDQQTKDVDLREIAAEAVGGATQRKEVIDRLLAYVQKRVRYTGLEFGEASIVPRNPKEVLTRGYGDCKDKACLMVTLLRSVGIKAQVTLLRVGSEFDVDPEMPGLAMFDHAIVHVPGPEPLWIDPTVRLAHGGELPLADQSRLALIVSEDTQELRKTPQSQADQNRWRQTVEVFLAEDGPGRVVESLEATGAEELYYRDGYSRTDAKKRDEFLKKTVIQRYQAEALGATQLSDADDLSQPFQLRFEALKAGVALTNSKEAAVFMSPWPLVDQFNGFMFASADRPNENSGDSSAAKPADRGPLEEPRRTDLILREPHVMEARWILHPPSGYANDSLPENRIETFGTAKLTSTYSKQGDGTVEALFRFECAQLRWTPQEVMDARKALRTFAAQKKVGIYFQNTGEAHLSAGRIKEALAEFRSACQRDPKLAAPLLRMARAQLAGGLGESARISARRAIELEPGSALAYASLAWILQHDTVGRRFKEGWQRKDAIAAYRKAIELDPKSRLNRWNLAVLLEYDERGDRYASGADLEESIRLYKALIAEEKTDSLDASLIRSLAFAGHFEEARAIAKSHLGADPWNEWYVAMTVCGRSLAEAKSDAAQCFQSLEARRRAFLNAGEVLVSFRRYEEAAALLSEGAAVSEQQTQTLARAEILAGSRKAAPPAWPPKDPRSATLLFLLHLVNPQASNQPLSQLLARAQRGAWEDELVQRFGRKLLNLPQFKGLPRPVVADLLQSLARFSVEGTDATGYRVHVEVPGYKSVFLVAAEEGTYRIVALIQDELSMARQALFLADQGDLKSAGAWLNMALESAYTGWPQDPLSPSPLHRLRTKGALQTRQEIRAAAASVLSLDAPKESVLAILREAVLQTKDKVQLQALRKALAYALLFRQDLREADLVTGQLQVANPMSYTAIQLRALFLMQAGRWEEALELTQRVLKLVPDDTGFTKYKLRCLLNLHRTPEADSLLEAVIVKGRFTSQDLSDLALYQVGLGLANARTLDLARRATQNSEDQNATTLQSLAAVMAELGRTSEARENLLNAVLITNRSTPRGEDWYVFGRIAEHLGDPAAAKRCYGRVSQDPLAPLAAKNLLVPVARKRMESIP
jgi:tetratricopeptide (TPR) repeat protein